MASETEAPALTDPMTDIHALAAAHVERWNAVSGDALERHADGLKPGMYVALLAAEQIAISAGLRRVTICCSGGHSQTMRIRRIWARLPQDAVTYAVEAEGFASAELL